MYSVRKGGTSAFSGMDPFVAILGLISICKKDNCLHMEAIDRTGRCNFFHEGKTPYTVILAGGRRNKDEGLSRHAFHFNIAFALCFSAEKSSMYMTLMYSL